MKPKMLYYSACYIFGGAENILVNLIYDATIRKTFDIHYAYARNRDYEAGVNAKFGTFANKYPLRLLDNANLFYRINIRNINKFIGLVLKVPFYLIQKSGFYNLYNLIKLLFFFRKMRPDLLHINNGGYPASSSCIVAVFSAKLAGIKRIVFNVNNLARQQSNFLE